MLRLAADENFNNNNVVRGVLRRNANVDIVRIQDAGLSGVDDQRRWNGRRKRAECCSRTM